MQHFAWEDQREILCYNSDVAYSAVLQLPWCTMYNFHRNVVQPPIRMHIIMLQLPMVCHNNTRIALLLQQVKLPLFIKHVILILIVGLSLGIASFEKVDSSV